MTEQVSVVVKVIVVTEQVSVVVKVIVVTEQVSVAGPLVEPLKPLETFILVGIL